jgi:elongator complex protein 5
MPSFKQILNIANGNTAGFIAIQTSFKSDRERAEFRRLRIGLDNPRSAPKPRARDCKQWIKRDNRHTGGVRKQRKPEARAPSNRMTRPITMAQYESHSLHLMSCVLGLRTNASPFTLVLDDLNQRAQPLIDEFIFRAMSRNINVVFLSFEAKNANPAIRFIPAWQYDTPEQILAQLELAMRDFKESLVIVDSLYDLLNVKGLDMSTLFETVAMKYCSSLLGIYHQDIVADHNAMNPYAPQPLHTFKYMATTVITCKSFAHVLAAKAAKERSLPEPTFGLLQSAEGVIQCLNANDTRGIVLDTEFRRKSGRTESETYFLRPSKLTDYNQPLPGYNIGTLKKEFVTLLSQNRAYTTKEVSGLVNALADETERKQTSDLVDSTFKLSLTDKEKAARNEVVLPYFDAQKNMGDAGEGGRILYDMGSEDDFDEEEDEI